MLNTKKKCKQEIKYNYKNKPQHGRNHQLIQIRWYVLPKRKNNQSESTLIIWQKKKIIAWVLVRLISQWSNFGKKQKFIFRRLITPWKQYFSPLPRLSTQDLNSQKTPSLTSGRGVKFCPAPRWAPIYNAVFLPLKSSPRTTSIPRARTTQLPL